jgi:hypothetical protein
MIAKLFADLAKAMNAPTWVISHGVVIILAVGGTIATIAFITPRTEKINQVPQLYNAITRIEVNQHKADSLNRVQSAAIVAKIDSLANAQAHANMLFRQKNRIDSLKFSRIQVLKENDYFQIMDQWFYRLQNSGLSQKKTSIPYAAIPCRDQFQTLHLK